MVKIFEDKDVAWDRINNNVVQVINVDPDGNCGYQAFNEACNYSKNIKLKFMIQKTPVNSISICARI